MHNLILTLIVFATTSLTEIAFFLTQNKWSSVPTKNFISLFVVLYLFSFIQQKAWRIMAMNMLIILSFFQMMHIQFFGMPVYPNAIYLFFTETSELFDTLFESLYLFTIPLLLIVPGVLLNIWSDKKAIKLKKTRYLYFLFIFYLLYNPTRTYKTGNTWGRQPSTQEFLGTNIYLSFSYFMGKILPHKVLGGTNKNSFKPKVKLSKKKPFQGNIILVLGESLSANHLSLFNYKRITTPFLDSLKSDSNFIFRRAISSGVSTDIAVAMFMNIT
ncbi:MAG: sulfatase-like hydrolase/transferase, partial [Halobacteriovoraceae bacterium]|nr:sulfatase-like hydrolase/transferase [Halobacteriovoraceae bacterium]